jgi:hypothetical protein
MGVKTNKDGTLTLNSTQFKASLTSYQDSVESIFGSDANSFSTSMKNLLEVYVDPISGIIKKAKDGLTLCLRGFVSLAFRRAEARTAFNSPSSWSRNRMDSVKGILVTPSAVRDSPFRFQTPVRRNESEITKPTIWNRLT